MGDKNVDSRCEFIGCDRYRYFTDIWGMTCKILGFKCNLCGVKSEEVFSEGELNFKELIGSNAYKFKLGGLFDDFENKDALYVHYKDMTYEDYKKEVGDVSFEEYISQLRKIMDCLDAVHAVEIEKKIRDSRMVFNANVYIDMLRHRKKTNAILWGCSFVILFCNLVLVFLNW